MKKRWHVATPDARMVCYLEEELHISKVLARILVNRGITSSAAGRKFLFDAEAGMHDPYAMKGMERVVLRINKALDTGENIAIFGDYDVDGMTSTSLLYNVLCELGGHPSFYIPDRQSEGYGPNESAFQKLASAGTSLIITVDCGIAAYDVVKKFQGKLDIIITDHHEPPELLPPAYAILNPKQRDDTYPCRQLAGVGVVYKLCQALWQHRKQEALPGYADLAALGTIADVVPLTGENRRIVKRGLRCMHEGHNMGLQALFHASGIEPQQVTAGRIAYAIAPRLNAAGRIRKAEEGVQLLLSRNMEKAKVMADYVSSLNQERQNIELSIARAAIAQIQERGEAEDGVLVAAGEGWHAGVIGIAASRLVDVYYKPSLVIGIQDDGIGKGSCRSIAGFNIYEALTYAKDLLLQFGGHPMAAGFSIESDNIDALRERLNEYASQCMKAEDYIPVLPVDMELQGSDISLSLIEELSCLEPYGMGNSHPVFSVMGAKIKELRPIGREKQHMRLVLIAPDGTSLSCVGWSMAARGASLLEGDLVDVAFQLERNDFNGLSVPQLVIQDIHEMIPAIHLDRETMIDIYLALKKRMSAENLPVWQARQYLLAAWGDTYTGHAILAALQVLQELGVLLTADMPVGPCYYLPAVTKKMCLHTSPTYQLYSQEVKEDHYGS